MDLIPIESLAQLATHADDLCDLFNASYGATISPSALMWQYSGIPDSNEVFMSVAVDDERIVGSYSTSPRIIQQDGATLRAALSLSTMTHPDYRGLGLFPRLATIVYERLAAGGQELVMGFPNRKSNHTFIRHLDWAPVADLPTFTAPLPPASPTYEPEFTASARIPSSFREIQLPLERPAWSVQRTLEYYQWRYDAHPTKAYEYILPRNSGTTLSDFAVVKRYSRSSIDLVEFHATNEDRALSLLASIAHEYARSGSVSANMWVGTANPLRGVLERFGFEPSTPIHTFGVRYPREGEHASVLNSQDWYMHMGDSDVF